MLDLSWLVVNYGYSDVGHQFCRSSISAFVSSLRTIVVHSSHFIHSIFLCFFLFLVLSLNSSRWVPGVLFCSLLVQFTKPLSTDALEYVRPISADATSAPKDLSTPARPRPVDNPAKDFISHLLRVIYMATGWDIRNVSSDNSGDLPDINFRVLSTFFLGAFNSSSSFSVIFCPFLFTFKPHHHHHSHYSPVLTHPPERPSPSFTRLFFFLFVSLFVSMWCL